MRILLALAFSCAMAFGQSFEVASVKPADPKSTPDARGGPGTNDPGELRLTNLPLASVLMRAFDLWSYDQIVGSASLRTSKYDIVAKIPPGTMKDQYHAMLVNLLEERFHMVYHHETRQFPAYEMLVAKNGPKLKASSAADVEIAGQNPGPPVVTQSSDGQWHMESPGMTMRPIFNPRAASSSLIARAQTMQQLAPFLGGLIGTRILDKTGLTGRYDFTLDYTVNRGVSTTPDGLDNAPPDILDAVQLQLGLKLQPVKIPLDTVLVESFDPVPTEN